MSRRHAFSSALALILLTAGAACTAGEGQSGPVGPGSEDGLHGTAIAGLYQAPTLDLTATDGTAFDLRADLASDLTLVFFGYTHCPDVCQVVMGTLATALTRLPEQDRSRVRVLFVTTDPARDDAQTLRGYLDRLDPEFEGLTGPLPRIEEAADAFGVPLAEGPRLPSGGYEVDHGTQVYAVDRQGSTLAVWTPGVSSQGIAEDLVVLLDDPASVQGLGLLAGTDG